MQKRGHFNKRNVYINRIIEANHKIFKEVLRMESAVVRELILEFIKEKGIEKKIRNKGKLEGKLEGELENKQNVAIEVLSRGFRASEIADIIKMPAKWVENATNK